MGAPFDPTQGPVDTSDRLSKLRELLKQFNLAAYIINTQDAHASEYIADVDKRREFISGFTGSAGTAVVTLDEARLFTDGRYFLQAELQLDKNWTLMRMGQKDVPSINKYLCGFPKGSRIGVDPQLMTASSAHELEDELAKHESELVPLTENLVDKVWNDQPKPPHNPVKLHQLKYAGKDTKSKIEDLQKYLEQKDAYAFVLTALEETAWLFNLRGSDIAFNPVFMSYAIITQTESTIFVDSSRMEEAAKTHLQDSTVKIEAYKDFFTHLKSHTLKANDKKIYIGKRASWTLAHTIGKGHYEIVRSPVGDALSLKNETEVEGFRECHKRDGAALVSYFAWLEEQLLSGAKLTEYQGSEKLEEFRAQQDLFVGSSFETISSTGPNAAIIHYSPDSKNSEIISADNVYLCDSGGQYHDGTTDVTRTLHFKEPTPEQIEAFTLVLKGVIAIDTAVYPPSATGFRIDVLARMPLWKQGLDYRHGTGHGVGSYLNVHEGVHGIGFRKEYDDTPLQVGMTVSDEPGFYKAGNWGIRIENVVVVRKADTPYRFGDVDYLGFEHLTMCPIQTKMIDPKLLTKEELDWVNNYHDEVYQKVAPILESKGDTRGLTWLRRETQKL